MKKTLSYSSSALIACSLLFVSSASAGEGSDGAAPAEDSAEAPRPKMDLSVATPPPPIQRTDYVHNGFYTRMSVGPGYMYASLNDKRLNVSAGSHAFALGADLLVGGSPSPGISFGGGVLGNIALGTQFNDVKGGALFNFTAGPFFDAFPNNKSGFHMGTLLGFSGMTLDSTLTSTGSTFLAGGGANAWLGYNGWVAPEWSAGVDLRTGGAYMVGNEMSGSVFNVNLMITILYN